MANYIPGKNPFNLAGPPTWWLRKLHDFDPSLVMIPSSQNFVYRLGQRRPVNLNMVLVNDMLGTDSDIRLMARHGVVPITTLLATVNWSNPLLWRDLANMSPDMHGGVDKYVKKIEDKEDRAAAVKAASEQDMLDILSKDSWKLYRKYDGLGRSWHHMAPLAPQFS